MEHFRLSAPFDGAKIWQGHETVILDASGRNARFSEGEEDSPRINNAAKLSTAPRRCFIQRKHECDFPSSRFDQYSKRWDHSQCDHCEITFECDDVMGVCAKEGYEDTFEREFFNYYFKWLF